MEAKGRLAGGVAHDLNNLFSIVVCYGGLLADEIPPGNALRPYLDEMLQATNRAIALTRQLMTTHASPGGAAE
jgi:signal transduction histidine kinase